MTGDMNRRRFLAASTTAAAGFASVAQAQKSVAASRPGRLKKAMIDSVLPAALTAEDRFKLAADLGFDGIEVGTVEDDRTLDEYRAAAEKSGLHIHSIMCGELWQQPLSSPDPAVVERGRAVLRRAIENAKALGADAVLVIPAVVTPQVRYAEAWERSQRELRRILPLARAMNVTLAIENVGNRFLLSPLEFARYIDELADPHVGSYFDVGNSLMLWSYPQDWILTLGPRIRRIHLKDCDFAKKRFVLLRDGDVDWPAVRAALDRVGYHGWLTFEPNYRSEEIERGDRAYLHEIAKRIDLIIAGR